jgi:hypothetical protein
LCGLNDLPHRYHLLKALRDTWAVWSPIPQAVLRDPDIESLRGELQGLHIIMQALGLGHYRWLPASLWLRFAAEALGDDVSVSVPAGLPWATRGKSPKRSGPKGYRLEDLERNVTWWYRVDVSRVSTYVIAREAGYTERNVAQILTRVRTLVACIEA